MSQRLQLKKEQPPSDAQDCPGCGKPLPGGAVICIECGYDTRTGRRIGESGRRKNSPVVIAGLILIIVGAVTTLYLRSKETGTVPAPASAADSESSPSAPEPSAETSTPESLAPATTEPALTAEAPTTATAESAPAAEAPAPASSEPASATAAEEPAAPSAPTTPEPETTAVAEEPHVESAPAIDWEKVEQDQRQRITAEMDRRAPFFASGQLVEFRLTNGLVRRGTYQGRDAESARLKADGNEVITIPIVSLDRNTRIRVDADYRQRYIEFLARQRVAEFRKRSKTENP
ncbi:MAG: zinc ribbon domain-containing protein [Kiritimatiellae bacterium]|nr:zinc ribbon domain-containing protein [Kiritimatiellia bacterium]MDW8458787.1 zinc ribbon domain-containing protein [Verrucomicrobiota bacterium]